jgi:hypothetical protein
MVRLRMYSIISLTFALMFLASVASAQVELRWSPGDTTIVSPGEPARLSLYIDDAINLRTVEITATYDTTVVTSLGGGSGLLYSDSGYFVFEGFEEEPGWWHGYAIVMGAGEYITGPGELLYWDIEGLAEGVSPVITVEAILYDEQSPPNLIPDVTLGHGTVIVGDPLSAVLDMPAAGMQMDVAPNPFNPRTRISFAVDRDTPATLSVFDARGHRISVLHDGFTQAGSLDVDWHGTDDAGRSQPGGVYFFLLETEMGKAWAKGILVK